MHDDALQNRATGVIRPLVPRDAEERVYRAYRQWNQIVRDHIRTEIGLKLSDGDSHLTISVHVVAGFPVPLALLIDQYRDPTMWRLIIGQPKLGGLVQGLNFLLQKWDEYEKWPFLPAAAKDGQPVLDHALVIATSLQKVARAEEVVQQLKSIREDILGVYRPVGQAPAVELYWMPIAMVAALLDVAIEDLAVVVLIHELTHGYTHLGRDIDGTSWDDDGFSKSDLEVTEGLAQFYTQVICERLSTRTPTLFRAYESLLRLQGGPYLVHRDWLEGDRRQLGETVRFTLIAARTQGRVNYEQWKKLMTETNRNLSARGPGSFGPR